MYGVVQLLLLIKYQSRYSTNTLMYIKLLQVNLFPCYCELASNHKLKRNSEKKSDKCQFYFC